MAKATKKQTPQEIVVSLFEEYKSGQLKEALQHLEQREQEVLGGKYELNTRKVELRLISAELEECFRHILLGLKNGFPISEKATEACSRLGYKKVDLLQSIVAHNLSIQHLQEQAQQQRNALEDQLFFYWKLLQKFDLTVEAWLDFRRQHTGTVFMQTAFPEGDNAGE